MKLILIAVAGLLCFSSIAQEDEKVIVLRRDDYRYKRKEQNAARNVENYNAFKFDPLRMAIGEIGFSWEHRIQEKTTLEFELGPTISNLGSRRFIDPVATPYSVTPAMGVLISAAARYYPLEDYQAMNKLYVSPKLKYRRYNEVTSAPGTTLSDIRGGSDEFIFSFNIGYQQWFSNNFAFDYYIGAGIASFNETNYHPNTVYNGNANTWTDSWQKSTTRYARFVGVIGVKVTIGN